MAKLTKDGATKIVDNKDIKEILLADGWKESKPKKKKEE